MKAEYPKSSINLFYCGLSYDTRDFEDQDEDERESDIFKRLCQITKFLEAVVNEVFKDPEFCTLFQ